jgi:hypothetical protein
MAQSPVPFTMPDGTGVTLFPLTERDHNEIDAWIKHQYMENVVSACNMLPREEREQLMKVALEEAATLTFQHGQGNKILLSSTFGVARLAYQLIKKGTSMTFEEFHHLLFPEGYLTVQGSEALNNMLTSVYRHLPTKNRGQKNRKKKKSRKRTR